MSNLSRIIFKLRKQRININKFRHFNVRIDESLAILFNYLMLTYTRSRFSNTTIFYVFHKNTDFKL